VAPGCSRDVIHLLGHPIRGSRAHPNRPTYDNPTTHTEGDVERGHPPDLTMLVDSYTWSRLPATDGEVRSFTDKPLTLRYRPAERKFPVAT
jgi:hypothetical protein